MFVINRVKSEDGLFGAVSNAQHIHFFSLLAMLLLPFNVSSQVELRGINTAPNLASSFNDAPLPRASEFNQPLDVLNDFYPSIEVRAENSSNIRRRSDQNESDNRLVISPGLAYKTNLGRHAFYAAYTGNFEYHSDFSSEDSTAHDLNAKLGLDISSRWDVDLFGRIGAAREERGVSGTRDTFFDSLGDTDDRDRIDYDRYGVDLIYGRKLERLKAVLGYERSTGSFNSTSGDEVLAGDRDRVSDSFHFDLEYKFSPRTAVFGRLEYTEIDFERSFLSFDSNQFDWLIGLRLKATGRLSGAVGYGGTKRDFDDGSLSGFNGNNYYVNLSYAFKPFSVFQFGATRSIEEPSSTDASLFVSEVFSISWEHALTDHLIFDSYVKLIDDDFNNGRRDEFVDYGFGLDYAVKPWLTVGVYFEEIDRDSNFDNIAFDDRIIGLRLKSDLRSLFSSRRNSSQIEPSSFRPSQRSQITNRR